jgi:hypothetical protein
MFGKMFCHNFWKGKMTLNVLSVLLKNFNFLSKSEETESSLMFLVLTVRNRRHFIELFLADEVARILKSMTKRFYKF